MPRLIALVVVAVCACTGCATVRHRPICGADDDARASGIRYFRGASYLFVQPDGKGAGTWQVLYLPDRSKIMVADPVQFLSSVNSTLTFDNGVLVKTEDEADATVVPKAIIGVIEKLAPLVFAAASVGAPEPPPPVLYKIIISGDTLELRGESDAKSIKYNLVLQEVM